MTAEVETRLLQVSRESEPENVLDRGWEEKPVQNYCTMLFDDANWSVQRAGDTLRLRVYDADEVWLQGVLNSRESIAVAIKGHTAEWTLKVPTKSRVGKQEIVDPHQIAERFAGHKLVRRVNNTALIEFLAARQVTNFNNLVTIRRSFRDGWKRKNSPSVVTWDASVCQHEVIERSSVRRRIIEVETTLNGVEKDDVKVLAAARDRNNDWISKTRGLHALPEVPGNTALCLLNHMTLDQVCRIYEGRQVKTRNLRASYLAGEISHERVHALKNMGIISGREFEKVVATTV